MKNPSDCLLTLEQAVLWRQTLRNDHRKLVITNGCFDVIHRGHAQYLYEARQKGDALLVLINSDRSAQALKGPGRPVNSELDRAYMLGSLTAVDHVVIFDTTRCDCQLKSLAPDVYVKAGDYSLETLDRLERCALETCGAKILFMPFVPGFSTTILLQKMQQ